MLKKIRLFHADQDGAVAVDWVVLTASIVALNMAILFNIIIGGIEENGTYIDNKIGESVSKF